jgi:hypothetical protein
MEVKASEFRIRLEEYEAASEDAEGFCVNCSAITNSGIEPDARHVECECCGARAVYGMEEALLGGLITVV